jgi:hypothetical protein
VVATLVDCLVGSDDQEQRLSHRMTSAIMQKFILCPQHG